MRRPGRCAEARPKASYSTAHRPGVSGPARLETAGSWSGGVMHFGSRACLRLPPAAPWVPEPPPTNLSPGEDRRPPPGGRHGGTGASSGAPAPPTRPGAGDERPGPIRGLELSPKTKADRSRLTRRTNGAGFGRAGPASAWWGNGRPGPVRGLAPVDQGGSVPV